MSTNEPEKMTAQQEVPYEGVTCECTADGTVPDYLPEIRRVLSVQAEAVPGGQYTGQNRAECAGNCRFAILYADPDGAIASVEAVGDFECSVPLSGADPASVTVCWEAAAETPTCRLGGPRKFSLRTVVCCRARVFTPGPDSLTPPAPGDGCGCEVLQKEQCVREVIPFVTDPIPLTGSVPCEAEGEIGILLSEGRVLVRECAMEEGVCLCRGEVRVGMLCESDSGAFPLSVIIPFEEEIAETGAGEGCRATCHGYLTECSCAVVEDGEGGRSIGADVAMVLDGCRMRQVRIAPTADLYSVHCPSYVRYGDCDAWENLFAGNYCFTLDGSVAREETGEDAVSVADTSVVLSGTRFSSAGNTLTAEADARVQMILLSALDADGHCTPSSVSFTYPVKMEVSMQNPLPAEAKITGCITLTAPHGRLDQSRFFFDCEASLSVSADRSRGMRIVTGFEADTDHPYPAPRTGMICAAYLHDDDTLWQVAKRYHVPVSAIAESNALPAEATEDPDSRYVLDGYVKLLIEE